MNRFKLLILMTLLAATSTFTWGIDRVEAGPGTRAGTDASGTPSGGTFFANSPAGVWSYTNAAGVTDPAFPTLNGGAPLGSSDSGTPLRKFVDRLPGLGAAGCDPTPLTGTCGANEIGQFIPIATPIANGLFPNDDYYEIGIVEYREQMHSDLPTTSGGTKLRGYVDLAPAALSGGNPVPHYMGPIILAERNKAVRLKVTNLLPPNSNLFIPVDHTYMGAGTGPLGGGEYYKDNRTSIHLHGGVTPWISDGTPHQWFTPDGETTSYVKGWSFRNVPDMFFDSATHAAVAPGTAGATTDPGPGKQTIYYTNQQSSRLMFYHEHALGTTRLGVYAGLAAGYLIWDQNELDLIQGTNVAGANSGNVVAIPDQADLGANYIYGIPLVIQDRTFVPQDVAVQDAKWNSPDNPAAGAYGDLWFPHVYETNQWPANPNLSGANDFGRWDYGPWFWPIFPVAIPGAPTMDVSGVPEGFMDTPVINGTAYPYLDVQPKAYRFQVLNACNDRFVNLQLYEADPAQNLAPPLAGLTEVKMVDALPHTATSALPLCAPGVTVGLPNYVTGAVTNPATGCWPEKWPTDNRVGGVPDPTLAGPQIIQIGTEGGILPNPVTIPNQPTNYEYNRRNIVVLNVLDKALFMGPAERADIIVDFSAYAGKTVILYNDSPAPVPAFDPRFDYYTGDPDNTWMGGAPSTLAGYGPNTRTIMQFRVAADNGSNVVPYTLDAPKISALQAAYVATQDPPIIPQTGYPVPYQAAADTYARIQDYTLTFTPVGGGPQQTLTAKTKAIQELFTTDYGRMNATLGTELPFTNALIQTTIPLGYVDPPTEIVRKGETQLWKITHNGVDTHAIHVHLFNAQVINRVGWDGAIRPPDPNELGWKETIRMNPLEDIIVALKPIVPVTPFAIPDSIRPLDPTQAIGGAMRFTNVDPYTNVPITVLNAMQNFGQEYVWHCHLLGHEENDMMRAIVINTHAKTDILWRNATTGSNLFWNLDGVSYTGYSASNGPTVTDPAWKIVGRADFDGDGKLDILWRNETTGTNIVWNMDGANYLGYSMLNALTVTDPAWQIVGLADFNDDGKPDILWRNETTGTNIVWNMDGVNYLGYSSLNGPTVTDPAWKVAGIGDFNSDGRPDLLWRNATTDTNIIWYLNFDPASGLYYTDHSVLTTAPAVADPNMTIAGVGDFNNDVYLDILWRNTTTGQETVWYMKGATYSGSADLVNNPLVTDTAWQIVGN